MNKEIFYNSVVVVTGGTGSFGRTIVSEILSQNPKEIRIFSRDENKQDAMRRTFKADCLSFHIGDVREESSVSRVLKQSDYVFHAAALKQVPSCDFFPLEAVQTNVLGSANVIEQSVSHEVKSLVCLSTDKAVYPINAMGMSKALMEKIVTSEARNNINSGTKINITRYGNVMMSRGSVIPLFIDQIRNRKPVTLTHPKINCFLMTLDDSVSLVKHAFLGGSTGDLFVQKAPATSMLTLANAIAKILGKEKDVEYKFVGIRHGEKINESLLSSEENNRAIDEGKYFRVPLDTRSLDYSAFFEFGSDVNQENTAYTSQNTEQLNEDAVIRFLLKDSRFTSYLESFKYDYEK